MATHTMRAAFTLGTTAWVNKSAADFASMGGAAHVGLATDRIRAVYVESVATQSCSVCYGPRTGSADDGARGLIGVPDPARLPRYSTLTLKNRTVELARDGEGDSGAKIDITGLSRAALRTKITALLTAAATGVANLVSVDGPTDDLIILQANGGEADAPVWSAGARDAQAWSTGLAEATAQVLAAGATPPIKALTGEETSVIALRANAAGSVVTIEIEVESHGSPVTR